MTLWFTADTHFGHPHVITHCNRPFESVWEMDETLIANWNECVRERDTVWHLGNFTFQSRLPTWYYVRRLHGAIHIVWGNHDDGYAKTERDVFASYQDVKYLWHEGEKITLYHYAQRVWRNSHRGAWHLYGHSCGSLPNFRRSMDVGVDAHKYRPVSFGEVAEYMRTQPVMNHHAEMATDPFGLPPPPDDDE